MPNEKAVLKRNPVSYSIWLMPEGSVREKLQKIIYSLSSNFRGPKIMPHVTLVSSFLGHEKDLLQKTEMLSKRITRFKIFFGRIDTLQEFFRSIFLEVKFTVELKKTRDIICNRLNWFDNDYFPHLSLAYGDYNKKEKQKMISTINILPDGFSVDHIFLAHNDEINLKWKVIQGFPLKK